MLWWKYYFNFETLSYVNFAKMGGGSEKISYIFIYTLLFKFCCFSDLAVYRVTFGNCYRHALGQINRPGNRVGDHALHGGAPRVQHFRGPPGGNLHGALPRQSPTARANTFWNLTAEVQDRYCQILFIFGKDTRFRLAALNFSWTFLLSSCIEQVL